MPGSRLAVVIKALRSSRSSIVKMGYMAVQRGFITREEIKLHDETREAAGLPSKADEGAKKRRVARVRRKREKRSRSAISKIFPWNW